MSPDALEIKVRNGNKTMKNHNGLLTLSEIANDIIYPNNQSCLAFKYASYNFASFKNA